MASWKEVALRDMRIPGHSGSYMSSYAANDDTWWLRNPLSAQRTKAVLVMGRYPTSEAWNPSINPDYSEASWVPSELHNLTWNSLSQWGHVLLGDTYTLNHAPGFQNNTRVMLWGTELWVKSKATGQWTRRIFENGGANQGNWYHPNFVTWYLSSPGNNILDPNTGYQSVRLPMFSSDPRYWLWHPWTAGVTIDPWDVADVISTIRSSLVLHDPNGVDDRAYSRFLVAVGADYTPTTSTDLYPSVGTSRHKFCTARWPNWQLHVMHTMTEAQLNAPNGYPSYFDSVSEGDDQDPGEPGEPTSPPIILPAVGAWAPLEAGGKSAWGAIGTAAPTVTSGGMPPPLRRRQ